MFVLSLLILMNVLLVESITFKLLPGHEKCVYDVVDKDVLITGAYAIEPSPPSHPSQDAAADGADSKKASSNIVGSPKLVKVIVKDPNDEELFSTHGSSYRHIKLNADSASKVLSPLSKHEDKFAFVSTKSGRYVSCFENEDTVAHYVTLRLRSGVEAKDLSEVAQHEHLKPLSIELLRLQQIVSGIRDEMLRMKLWEAEMRDLNETTNSRVTMFSLFSVFIVLTLGISQVHYLRNFLASKKVI